ncbi:pyridoxamine 5'-phosphate oxidase family protein [Piscinibacter sp. HJYY11]|uniref:pyridoxamine 5'-phosphate oxidase family protein n=1 Tax=Piscinibacter sp. HJYY11 TaxID=2801333 RepID=UPI00191E3621|nr:pyridoxamine 5'-phosphate oxidase family protein [Piscinibacter sp. HJYY11]MBL0727949.1 pyridoxamine 5'-phosphate oxidase family protein [Piscinibacter sp. HJYY11]
MSAPRLASLPEIEAAVWRELVACVRDKQHAWRNPVLATTDGELADGRVVVLREALPEPRRLLVYTDRRSAKAAQLASHPLGTLVMWSRALGWQLRCRVKLSLETSGLAVTSRWAQIKLSPAAQDYLSPWPPGTALDEPRAMPRPDPEALGHFAVVDAQVQSIDWLELHPDGQRRAVFETGSSRWVQP